MTRNLNLAALVSLFSLATGCGPGNTFNGTVDGKSFKPQSASLVPLAAGEPDKGVAIFISDRKEPCPKQANPDEKLKGLLFMLYASDGKGGALPLKPASYPVLVAGQRDAPTYQAVTVRYAELDSGNLFQAESHEGAVKLDAIDVTPNGTAAGSFDFTWEDGHTTGTFLATYCPPGA